MCPPGTLPASDRAHPCSRGAEGVDEGVFCSWMGVYQASRYRDPSEKRETHMPSCADLLLFLRTPARTRDRARCSVQSSHKVCGSGRIEILSRTGCPFVCYVGDVSCSKVGRRLFLPLLLEGLKKAAAAPPGCMRGPMPMHEAILCASNANGRVCGWVERSRSLPVCAGFALTAICALRTWEY